MKLEKLIVLDFETDGLSTVRGQGKIHCFGLANDHIQLVYPWDLATSPLYLQDYLDEGYKFICHHAEFDIATFNSHTGMSLTSDNFLCTQVLAHAVNPLKKRYSLDALTGQKLDYGAMMQKRGLWDGLDKAELYRIPFNDTMAEYCLQDCIATWELFKDLNAHLDADPRLEKSYLEVLNPFVEVMMSLYGGMYIDATKMMSMLAELSADIETGYSEFLIQYPTIAKLSWKADIKQWIPNGKMGVPNLGSPNDVTSLLIMHGWQPDEFKFDTGRPVTSQNVLRRLAVNPDISEDLRVLADRLQKLRALIGIRTQCISLMEIVVEAQSPIIHASWHQTGTVTHRMACSNPNLQNISTRHPVWGKKMRSCFTPPPGYSMLVGDLSQIELAILAFYLEVFCGDSTMAQAARDGKDFHSANAEAWLHANKELDPEGFVAKRKTVKNGIFATNYGAGVRRVALTLNISDSEALEVITTVNDNTPIQQMKDLFWATTQTVRPVKAVSHMHRRYNSGFFYDVMGVRHFYPDINSNERYKQSSAKRQSFNCLMQGGCFSIFANLLNQLLPYTQDNLGWVAGIVHDEAILYVPTLYAEALLVEANRVFSSFTMETPQGGVPVKAEFSIVNDWSEK